MRISDWSSDVCSSDLNADGQSALQIAQISKCQVTVCLNILQVRRGRRNQNGARCRRTPEQGTLRTFENLDRRQVVQRLPRACIYADVVGRGRHRSEEHTSELQSLMRISYAVFCLKKKKNEQNINTYTN